MPATTGDVSSDNDVSKTETRMDSTANESNKESDLSNEFKRRQRRPTAESRSRSDVDLSRWLEDNYELCDDGCLRRHTLFSHYLDFCCQQGIEPVNAASFGKIIKQQFPTLTSRRLGTRGQSKYHYHGITIKKSSCYFKMAANLSDSSNSQGEENDSKKPTGSFGSSSKVQSFLIHFWQGMPSHLSIIMESAIVQHIIAFCDCLLYKVVMAVLVPTTLQAIPDSLVSTIENFSSQFEQWLPMALQGLPKSLSEQKLEVARAFCKTLKGQASLTHLCQAARNVLRSSELVGQMVADWKEISVLDIVSQSLWAVMEDDDHCAKKPKQYFDEFYELLERQASLEHCTDWLTRLMNCRIRKLIDECGLSREESAREFYLKWSFFISCFIRELTLNSAPSFGSFHLLLLMLGDYILYLAEIHGNQAMEEGLRLKLKTHCRKSSELPGPSSSLAADGASASEKKQQRPPKLPISNISFLLSNQPIHSSTPTVPIHQFYPLPNSGQLGAPFGGLPIPVQPNPSNYPMRMLPGQSMTPGPESSFDFFY